MYKGVLVQKNRQLRSSRRLEQLGLQLPPARGGLPVDVALVVTVSVLAHSPQPQRISCHLLYGLEVSERLSSRYAQPLDRHVARVHEQSGRRGVGGITPE